jgi:hypothetical protein
VRNASTLLAAAIVVSVLSLLLSVIFRTELFGCTEFTGKFQCRSIEEIFDRVADDDFELRSRSSQRTFRSTWVGSMGLNDMRNIPTATATKCLRLCSSRTELCLPMSATERRLAAVLASIRLRYSSAATERIQRTSMSGVTATPFRCANSCSRSIDSKQVGSIHTVLLRRLATSFDTDCCCGGGCCCCCCCCCCCTGCVCCICCGRCSSCSNCSFFAVDSDGSTLASLRMRLFDESTAELTSSISRLVAFDDDDFGALLVVGFALLSTGVVAVVVVVAVAVAVVIVPRCCFDVDKALLVGAMIFESNSSNDKH